MQAHLNSRGVTTSTSSGGLLALASWPSFMRRMVLLNAAASVEAWAALGASASGPLLNLAAMSSCVLFSSRYTLPRMFTCCQAWRQ